MGAAVNTLYNGCDHCQDHIVTLSGRFISDRDLNRLLRQIFDGQYEQGDIAPELFDSTFQPLFDAVDEGYGDLGYGHDDYDFKNELRHNAAVYSAFKSHQQTAAMVSAMRDENGNLRSFSSFREEARKISGQYNELWLETEFNTATIAARSAAQWRGYERTAHLYPNLEYMPSRSADRNPDHIPLYNIIKPLDDAFWDANLPPNRWGCKCWTRRTRSAPAGELSEELPVVPGIVGNPGKAGQIISPTHPIVQNTSPSARQGVRRQLDKLERQSIRSRVSTWSESNLKDTEVKARALKNPVQLKRTGIKRAINQPHRNYNAKNLLMYNLPEAIRQARIVQTVDAANGRFHYMGIKVNKEDSYVVVRELKGGQAHLHTIVDQLP